MSRFPAAVQPDREAEFTRDWNDGMLSSEMAGKYGCTATIVSRTAARLGLHARYTTSRRTAPKDEIELTGGQWVTNGRVMVWTAA